MFLIVAVLLAVLWGLGWFAFHAAGGLIHLLLLVSFLWSSTSCGGEGSRPKVAHAG